MAEEPQPSTIHEGASSPTHETDNPVPPVGGAEDRKAAAVLSALDARGDDDEKPAKKSEADQKALDEAMSRLELLSGGKEKEKAEKKEETEGEKRQRLRKKQEEEEREKRKKTKVDAADVALLVSMMQCFHWNVLMAFNRLRSSS